jgi:phospholipase C
MRKFYLLVAAVILAAIPTVPAAASPAEDAPTTTPIKHVVWMMQDNHSFDNYFGTYPGADGIPSGVCQRLNLNLKSTKGCVQPFHIGDTPIEDLSQGPGVQRRQYNGGRMDGFVAAYRRLGLDGTSAMGYYDGSDIPFHWNAADQYVLFDRFFASTTVGSREAYLYWVASTAPAGQTPLRSSAGYDALPTIFDRLAERQISAKFYVENLDAAATRGDSGVNRTSQLVKVPLLGMKRFRDGGTLAGQVVDLSQYYLDLRNGTLPAVSYIVTTKSSENPPADPGAGSRTLRKVTSELMKSSAWSTSALMWTYDGWGGWYDHVPPPRVDNRGYGFRVPALLVSPYAKKGVVDHTVLDYTAMLHFIETNWNLKPLSVRDRQSAGLASAFDFAAPPRAGTLLSWTWPAPKVRAATDSPTPVIYSVYGAAAALAIAIVSLAVYWRGRITVPGIVGRGVVLTRFGVESMRDRMQRFLHGRRYSLRALASWAAARRSEEDRSKPPARFSDSGPAILTIPSRPRPEVVGDGQDSTLDLYQATKQPLAGSRNGHVPASAALALISQERAEQSNVALEPIFGDGRVSVEQSASDVNAATDAEVNTEMRTDLPPRVKPPTEAEPATDAEVEPATEAGPPTEAEPTSAEAELPTDADADEPAAVETSAMPVHSRAVRHQRRNLSRRQRRNLSRRRNGVRT